MTRTEWLASLRVGDEVVFHAGRTGSAVARVTRITPKRTRFELRVPGHGTWRREVGKDGTRRSADRWSTGDRIEPLTPEWRAEQELKARRERLADEVRALRFLGLRAPQLDAAEPLVAQLARVLRGER